ncbi:acyl-CoA reductase-like NAD-dependent aldehyde dehydrogenase [Pseudomonas sp. JAI111]|nr:acyl-CoA reductase-like NAD-dependent aldehyde dehydrogenase [Pseudomonas sp. JAI111]
MKTLRPNALNPVEHHKIIPIFKSKHFEPTVLADAQHDDEIVRREVFGPEVAVTKFTDEG